jgi:capsular polysaccharide biosynthesis protein
MRRSLRTSIVVGLLVTLLLVAAGAVYAFTQPRAWVAESMVVVLPSAELDEATSASYYETLSRGQIVATFAEIAGSQRFSEQAEERLGLSAAQRAAVTTEVTVVPDTAVLLIRSTAGDAEVARQVAAETTDLSVQYLAGLSRPFRAVTVPSARGAAEPTGTPPLLLMAAALVAGLVTGLAVQQAVYHLTLAARGPAAPEPAPLPPGREADGPEVDGLEPDGVRARRGPVARV